MLAGVEKGNVTRRAGPALPSTELTEPYFKHLERASLGQSKRKEYQRRILVVTRLQNNNNK
ncbi:MAG: hypothetical protein WA220_09270 [Candidatus Nitrosopolaris sp.]